MKQIIPHLHVCSMFDYEALGPAILRYSVLGACKEPLYRKFARLDGADEDGYVTRSMPSDNAEYLWAERSHALYLNMVDARDAKFFSWKLFDKALDFLDDEIEDGRDVLIVCNKGESRSPSIALLYMLHIGYFSDMEVFYDIVEKFKREYYKEHEPNTGIYEAILEYWRNM